MKKIVSTLLLIILMLTMVGCSANKNIEAETNSPTTVIPKPQEPITTPTNPEEGNNITAKYENKYFSTTALEQVTSQYSRLPEEIKAMNEMFKEINGTIKDVYIHDNTTYFLTDKYICCVNKEMTIVNKFNANIGDNNEFVVVSNQCIILKNDAGEVTVYTIDKETFTSMKDEKLNIDVSGKKVYSSPMYSRNDMQIEVYMEYLCVIENMSKDGIVVSQYSTYDGKVEKERDYTIVFPEDIKSNLKEFIVNDATGVKDIYALLNDGTLYHMNFEFESNTTTYTLKYDKPLMEDVETILSAYYNEVWALKAGDKINVWNIKYTRDDGEDRIVGISKSPVSIQEISDFAIAEETLLNGKLLKAQDGRYYEKNARWEYVKNTTITEILADNSFIGCFEIDFFVLFVMDDGVIYTVIDDAIIDGWNVK